MSLKSNKENNALTLMCTWCWYGCLLSFKRPWVSILFAVEIHRGCLAGGLTCSAVIYTHTFSACRSKVCTCCNNKGKDIMSFRSLLLSQLGLGEECSRICCSLFSPHILDASNKTSSRRILAVITLHRAVLSLEIAHRSWHSRLVPHRIEVCPGSVSSQGYC